MKTGKIYAVSVGPGDPLLMTQKAVRTIEHCRVVAYPVTRSGQTLARDIAAQACVLSRLFPHFQRIKIPIFI